MPEPFTGLKVVDFLGVFYREEGRLMVADEYEGGRDVGAELDAYVGREVRLLAHHRPQEPHDEARWGGGCCLLEPGGRCHFGHHDDPRRLFTFNSVGVLRRPDGRWILEREDEQVECLVDMLVGHRSQVVVTTIPDLEGIDEKVKSFDPSSLEGATLEEMSEKLTEMREFLAEINQLKNDV